MPGPHVQLATFCEKVLVEQDGVMSVIRMLDRVIVTIHAKGAPAELPEGGTFHTTLAIALKADDARGRYPVTIRAQDPSGRFLPDQSFDATFEREERGVNLVLNIGIPVIEGLFWFDVLVNEQPLTRVPLRITYQRIPLT